jgi:hypothetical protein
MDLSFQSEGKMFPFREYVIISHAIPSTIHSLQHLMIFWSCQMMMMMKDVVEDTEKCQRYKVVQ